MSCSTFSEELKRCNAVIEDLDEDKAELENLLVALRLQLGEEKSRTKLRERVIADLEKQIERVCLQLVLFLCVSLCSPTIEVNDHAQVSE